MSSGNGKWVRSRDRMIGGVCGGIALALGWPADRLRVAWAIVTLITGFVPLVVLYLVLWFVMPAADEAPVGTPPS